MGIYYFHIRDELGLIEDPDGIEIPDSLALLMEIIQSTDEFVRETDPRSKMRLEVTDAHGQTVLMTPVQQSSKTWELLAYLSAANGSVH